MSSIASTSTSWWKRTASSTKISASRNAVAPNAPTANSARRRPRVSITARQPAQGLQPLRVEPADVAREVGEREVAEILDQRRDLGLGARPQVVLARERRGVDV